jgi:hypothetical protein
MIKANELRIGNMFYPIDRTGEVHLPINIPYKVGQYYLDAVRGYMIDEIITGVVTLKFFKLRDISPIPLTEEWLVRFGFEKSSNGYFKFPLEIRGLNLVFFGNKFSKRGLNLTIQHVHQLQNLYFALTGEELELDKKTGPQ